MGKEYEAKYLDIDVLVYRRRLRAIGAKLVHSNTRMVRTIFDCCDKDGFVRLRHEGDKVTLTSKIFGGKYPEEHEVTICEPYENGIAFLTSIGLKKKAVQETMREKWNIPSHKDVNEIVFDMIPGIPTYMEIDCKSEAALHYIESKLGLDTSKRRYGSFDKQYLEYYGIPKDVINADTPSITFLNIHKEIKPKKQKQLLIKVQRQQLNAMRNVGKTKTRVADRTKTRVAGRTKTRVAGRTKRTKRTRKSMKGGKASISDHVFGNIISGILPNKHHNSNFEFRDGGLKYVSEGERFNRGKNFFNKLFSAG